MTLYDLIYQFFYFTIFGNNTIILQDWLIPLYSIEGEAYNINLQDWLSHTLTIIVLVLFVVALIKLVIWVFKLGANIVRIR